MRKRREKKDFAVQTGRGKKRIVFLLQEYCIKSASKKQDKCLLINRLDVLFQKRENEEEKTIVLANGVLKPNLYSNNHEGTKHYD